MVEEDDYIILYKLEDFKIYFQASDILYYWVDPRINSGENQKYLTEFRNNKLNVETFSSV